MCKNTIEEYVYKLQESKRLLISNIVDKYF